MIIDKGFFFRHKNEDTKWRNFVESIRSKLTVKQVVDGVRGGGELSFDYITLIITAELVIHPTKQINLVGILL